MLNRAQLQIIQIFIYKNPISGISIFCFIYSSQSQSPCPCPMAHRAAPTSVFIALGHASANAVKATAGGWSTGSSAGLTFSLHSHMSSTRREGKGLWYDSARARTRNLPVVRHTLNHWAVTTVTTNNTNLYLQESYIWYKHFLLHLFSAVIFNSFLRFEFSFIFLRDTLTISPS